MHHRNDDDNFSRSAREWDRERDRHSERHRDDEHRERSFHPGGYGFDDPSRSEREYSPQYGQREPYAGRADWGRPRRDEGAHGQSRYSESQYGQNQYDSGRNWSAGRGNYSNSPDWDAWDRNQRYGREPQRPYGAGYRDENYESAQRYGVGYSGSQGYGRERPFGDERFNRGDQPRYYGTGYYGEGTSAFGGGFGEERSRSQPASYGRFGEAEHGSRFYGGGSEHERSGQRPGLLRRLFGTGPKGYQRSDERLREDISERLMQAPNIDSSEVTVNVAGGKVTLEGTVPERYMKHAIEDLVDACPGVQDIDNRVRVDRNAGSYASGTTSGTSYGSTGASASSPGTAGASGTTTGATGGGSTAAPTRTTRRDS